MFNPKSPTGGGTMGCHVLDRKCLGIPSETAWPVEAGSSWHVSVLYRSGVEDVIEQCQTKIDRLGGHYFLTIESLS